MIKFNVKLKKNENIIKINLKYCVVINKIGSKYLCQRKEANLLHFP